MTSLFLYLFALLAALAVVLALLARLIAKEKTRQAEDDARYRRRGTPDG
jgi:hypothetical protein